MRKFLWELKWASSTFSFLNGLPAIWYLEMQKSDGLDDNTTSTGYQGLQNDFLYLMYWHCWSKIMTLLGYFSSRNFIFYCVFLHIVWSISNLNSKLDNGLFIDLIDRFNSKSFFLIVNFLSYLTFFYDLRQLQ